jgi:hypothetical protein
MPERHRVFNLEWYLLFLNPHLMERPDSPDWSIDLTEFRKAVFWTLLKRAGSHLARLWSAELAEYSESSQTASVAVYYLPITGG